MKKFHLRKLSLIISSITVSIICDLLKQLLQWSQLTLTQLVRRLYCSERWKICKSFLEIQGLDQVILSKGWLLYKYVKDLLSYVLNFKAMIVQRDTETIKWNTCRQESFVQAIMNLKCSRHFCSRSRQGYQEQVPQFLEESIGQKRFENEV